MSGKENMRELILASNSPRRKEILSKAGYVFGVKVSRFSEIGYGDPIKTAEQNALGKAEDVFSYEGEKVVLGADTVVFAGGKILGKPADGKAAKEETVDVNRTSYLATGSFEASGLTLEAGRHDVSIELTGVNGKEDSDPTDNTTRTKNVLVIDEFTPRNMLFEVFSTEKCVNCPQAHAVIANTYKDFKDVIELGHHSAYYDDKFTIQASLDYEWFYTNQSMLFAPAGMFDRTCFDDNLPMFYDVKSPVTGLGSSELLVIRQEALSVPAFTTVNIEKSLDKEARKLTLDVSGKALLPIDNPEKVRLYVFLKEDSIYTETQNGASGGFYQRHVARLSMTPTWGDPIDVENGFEATYSADIPEECNIDNMYAVAFVAYYDPEDHLNCNVLNKFR